MDSRLRGNDLAVPNEQPKIVFITMLPRQLLIWRKFVQAVAAQSLAAFFACGVLAISAGFPV